MTCSLFYYEIISLLSPRPQYLASGFEQGMEDLNMMAADCIVISCCCQCLVLQIVVFILLKLPYKLIRKAKQYVKKLRNQKKKANAITRQLSGCSIDGVIRSHSGSLRIKFEGLLFEECCGNCMDEIEKTLEDMSRNGEFALGSFWKGGNLEESLPTFIVQNFEQHEFQYNLVTYNYISIFILLFEYSASKPPGEIRFYGIRNLKIHFG